jgi:LEA14-like dessication related protein
MKKCLFVLTGLVLGCFGACVAAPPAEEPPLPVSVPAGTVPAPEQRILEPVFSISSIVILQAELINLRFKARLRIDNPNSFPLELSAFSYELHGAGRYWAEGEERETLAVPSEGHVEKDLFLLMNFINMRRETLDRVIALKTLDYRFSGEAMVRGGGETLALRFEESGESPVER